MQPEPAKQLEVEYTTQGGAELGAGLHEVEQRLHVDYGAQVVLAERYQPSSDEGGEPVGSFRAPLPPELGDRLRSELAKLDPSKLTPGTAGGPGASHLRIRVTGDGPAREVSLSSRDIPLLEKLEPLLDVLDALAQSAFAQPLEAVQLTLAQKPAGARGTVFTLVLKNIGMRPIVLPNPKALPAASAERPTQSAGLRLAAYPQSPPGVTAPPLEWAYLPLAGQAPGGAPAVLQPGEEARFDTEPSGAAASKGRHLAQGIFSSYQAARSDAGAAPVLGRLLSEALVLEH